MSNFDSNMSDLLQKMADDISSDEEQEELETNENMEKIQNEFSHAPVVEKQSMHWLDREDDTTRTPNTIRKSSSGRKSGNKVSFNEEYQNGEKQQFKTFQQSTKDQQFQSNSSSNIKQNIDNYVKQQMISFDSKQGSKQFKVQDQYGLNSQYTKQEQQDAFERKYQNHKVIQQRKLQLKEQYEMEEQQKLKPNFTASQQSSQILSSRSYTSLNSRTNELLSQKQFKISQQQELKKLKELEELEKYDFKPKINKKSQKMMGNKQRSQKEFINSQQNWQKKSEQKIHDTKMLFQSEKLDQKQLNQVQSARKSYITEQQQKLEEEKTFFKPKINKNSEKMVKKMNDKKNGDCKNVQERLYKKQIQYDQKKIDREQNLVPSFQPILSPKSVQIVDKMGRQTASLKDLGSVLRSNEQSSIQKSNNDQYCTQYY